MSTPLPPDDLRAIADTIEKITDVLYVDGEWTLPYGASAEFSIPLTDPINENKVIGYAVLEDGWIGFSFTDPHNKIGFNG